MGRTGYTAEDGFEIYIPNDETISARVWYSILDAGKEFGGRPLRPRRPQHPAP